jgi:nifR3 family TIM-barrel protein
MTGKAVLAPMAGIADNAYRIIAKSEGASMVFTELISADGIIRKNPKTYSFLNFLPEERPIGIQIFGKEPDIIAEAVRYVQTLKPEMIDLNFGCPSKRIVKNGSGAAILKNLPLMRSIVRAAVSASSIPVSGKIRTGWDDSDIVAVEAAQILEEEGACFVTVHARTWKMGFRGRADWSLIRKVKESVSIPVIGNGDIKTQLDTKRMFDETGCDLVMIGRGAMGRPWIFDQINRFLKTGKMIEDPSYQNRIDKCLEHYNLALELTGIDRGVKEMRKHIGWYLKGMPGSSSIRQEVFTMSDPDGVKSRLEDYKKRLVK